MSAQSGGPAGYRAEDIARPLPEPGQRPRPPFIRDRARVLHSAGLRRLAAKTQVVHAGWGDFPRTRLTHTLEVAQIGRELAGRIGADPDLVETACLAHDIGHPPFGHNGEVALAEASSTIGGFEANAQTLRLLTRLEAKIVTTVDGALVSGGLNLTRASLDAVTKYPWPRAPGRSKWGVYDEDRPVFDWCRQPAPGRRLCIEAQLMDIADDIAYSVHDVEDAIHAGFLDCRAVRADPERQQVIDVARAHYLADSEAADLAAELEQITTGPRWPAAFDGSLPALVGLKALTSELIGEFTTAVAAATRAGGDLPLLRYGGNVIVPVQVQRRIAVLKSLVHVFVMHREGAAAGHREQRDLLIALVGHYRDQPEHLSTHHRERCAGASAEQLLRIAIDEVAELTDTSAWQRAAALGLA